MGDDDGERHKQQPASPPRAFKVLSHEPRREADGNVNSDLIILLAENQEKLYLYLIISVTAGVLICLTLLVLRLMCQRRHPKADDQETDVHETSFQKSNTGETTIPNGFSDDISEIDADIDLTATLPISSVTRNDVSST